MALTRKHLSGHVASVTIDVAGEKLTVWYAPSLLAPANKPTDADSETIPQAIARVARRWDYLDDEGKEIPITPEVVEEFPHQYQNAIYGALLAGEAIPKNMLMAFGNG